jgi:hypothetical protein
MFHRDRLMPHHVLRGSNSSLSADATVEVLGFYNFFPIFILDRIKGNGKIIQVFYVLSVAVACLNLHPIMRKY